MAKSHKQEVNDRELIDFAMAWHLSALDVGILGMPPARIKEIKIIARENPAVAERIEEYMNDIRQAAYTCQIR